MNPSYQVMCSVLVMGCKKESDHSLLMGKPVENQANDNFNGDEFLRRALICSMIVGITKIVQYMMWIIV